MAAPGSAKTSSALIALGNNAIEFKWKYGYLAAFIKIRGYYCRNASLLDPF